jgi:hypothetical protein
MKIGTQSDIASNMANMVYAKLASEKDKECDYRML